MTIRCENLESLLHFTNNLSDPVIGFFGGEYFTVKHEKISKSYQLNDVVRCLTKLYEKEEASNKVPLATKIVHKINQLNYSARQALTEKNIFTRIFAAIRRVFGNVFFNREKVIENVAMKIKAARNSNGEVPRFQDGRVREFREEDPSAEVANFDSITLDLSQDREQTETQVRSWLHSLAEKYN